MIYDPSTRPQIGLVVKKFQLTETGTYNQQYRRPYSTEMDVHTLAGIRSQVAGHETIQPSLLAGIASNFVKPSADFDKAINIDGGWTDRRLRYELTIEVNTGLGTFEEVIQGYTDGMGITADGSIAPDMNFTINSVLKINTRNERHPTGMVTVARVADASHMFGNDEFTGIYNAGNDVRMRPMDVYNTMSVSYIPEAKTTMNALTLQDNVVQMSRRSNAVPANYMKDILTGYQTAILTNSYGIESKPNLSGIYSAASGNVSEMVATEDVFVKAISSIQGVIGTRVFRYRDLVALDPMVPMKTQFIRAGNNVNQYYHQSGQTQDWGYRDGVTQAAAMLSNSIPALLMELMLTSIHIRTSNRTLGCQLHSEIINYKCLNANVDMSNPIKLFVQRFESEIISNLTYNNQIDIALELRCDLMGETWISLSLGGDPPIDYVTPSFADALITPVMTNDNERVIKLAQDFDALVTTCVPTADDFQVTVEDMPQRPQSFGQTSNFQFGSGGKQLI